jgi:hypothetical protein
VPRRREAGVLDVRQSKHFNTKAEREPRRQKERRTAGRFSVAEPVAVAD